MAKKNCKVTHFGSRPRRRILVQSEMNGMCQRSEITAGDCRLSFLTSAFTHNSPLSLTYPMISPLGDKVRWYESLPLTLE